MKRPDRFVILKGKREETARLNPVGKRAFFPRNETRRAIGHGRWRTTRRTEGEGE